MTLRFNIEELNVIVEVTKFKTELFYFILIFQFYRLNPLTYDLRSRILDQKRKQARAAFEPFARLV